MRGLERDVFPLGKGFRAMPEAMKSKLEMEPLEADEVSDVAVTAVYQKDGCIALTKSASFSAEKSTNDLLRWALEFEDLGVEFLRLEIEPEDIRRC